ncbi:MAG TPA: hypothetical protein PK926_17395 [Spirochaetota bacterium]|nr:hypothetical protein [Spirochaetota bacterium]HPI90320.1 hypothetical protein [Spirochaetota bacterium]HPR49720.1 hypothetical protein [Spirochaetota bacterium]
MSFGTACLLTVLFLVVVRLFRYIGILFIMMMIINNRETGWPAFRNAAKLQLVKTADTEKFFPAEETFSETGCREIMPA